jgi:hypothetical protein
MNSSLRQSDGSEQPFALKSMKTNANFHIALNTDYDCHYFVIMPHFLAEPCPIEF